MTPKTCGTCTLCCKLFPVPPLEKPAGKWCPHVVQGRGCGIHETRPGLCRAFDCQWLENPDLGPEWKPEIAKFVLSIYPGTNSLAVTVDPGFPGNWRQEPYLRNLRRWAEAALRQGDQVIVLTGGKATAILPDREQELGEIGPGDSIVSLKGPRGYAVEVRRGARA
ncbi:MAG: hypothetical protein IOC55_12780 [Methylobacterium sp.]|nr:hypothetical protein [Methylobacterium sp.]